jgi:hypothetical protein
MKTSVDKRRLWGRSLAWAALLWLAWAAAAQAQVPEGGAEGPAAPGLHRTFRLGTLWAMYGAPQEGRLNRAEFDKLAGDVEATRFAADNVQVVVILRGADAGGTIGLVEKRGGKFTRLFAEPEGPTAFDIWRRVGCRLTPERILADYRENILAAEDIYRDLPIQFTGQVKRVARDEQGAAFVEFSIRRTDMVLACHPWPGAPQLEDPRTLRAGQRLEVAGQFAEYNQTGLKVHSCLFSPPR